VAVTSSTGRVLRVVAFLTVLGFLTFVLISPVLALVIGALSVMAGLAIITLPFALIGLLVWSAYLVVARDRRVAWQNLHARLAGIGHWFVTVPWTACVRLCAWGAGAVQALAPVALPVARRAGEVARDGVEAGVVLAGRGANAAAAFLPRARSAGQRIVGVLLEVIGGAAVGTILVCLVDSSTRGPILALHIVAGAIAGGCLGLLVGAARSVVRPEQG
jgi:hypothetical protein